MFFHVNQINCYAHGFNYCLFHGKWLSYGCHHQSVMIFIPLVVQKFNTLLSSE